MYSSNRRTPPLLYEHTQESGAHRLWHLLDAASTQRALVQRGVASLPSPSLDVRAWRGPRLRRGVEGATVGDNYEKDYLPAVRGKGLDNPLPSSLMAGQGLKFWLPEDRCVEGFVGVGMGL